MEAVQEVAHDFAEDVEGELGRHPLQLATHALQFFLDAPRVVLMGLRRGEAYGGLLLELVILIEELVVSLLIENSGFVDLRLLLDEVLPRLVHKLQILKIIKDIIEVRLVLRKDLLKLVQWLHFVFLQRVNR